MTASGLTLEHLSKAFGDHVAVRDLSLEVAPGQVLALLGPSGSGKTTTLRLIAGFERPDAGRVVVGGVDVTAQGPAQRRFGMVFQHYALFPHLTVTENVAFGLERTLSREERAHRVASALTLVDLAGFERRAVAELSGGQQQRVAVARAVAPQPPLLLLDEPLSNLDPSLRDRTRRELRAAIDQLGVTTVFVTHEQEEAFALGDVVAVLRDGGLEQVDEPTALYEAPQSLFVATFVGRASTVPGVMVRPDRARLMTGVEWPVRGAPALNQGDAVTVAVRPEAVTMTDGAGLRGEVRAIRYLGGRALFEIDTELGAIDVEAGVRDAAVGDVVWLAAQAAHAFPNRWGA